MNTSNHRGYLLLQCAIALFCLSIGFSLLLTSYVRALSTQKAIRSYAWALVHASSARAIQSSYSSVAINAWQQQLTSVLPEPNDRIDWQRLGAMTICWEEATCWQLD